MLTSRMANSLAELVHEKPVDILGEAGFCVPEPGALACLAAAGFQVDRESQMVRVTYELLDAALASLPRDVNLRLGRRDARDQVHPSTVSPRDPHC